MPRVSVVSRFWDFVDKSGDCWEWTAGLNSAGYGGVHVGAKKDRAHRVAWEEANGPIPPGLCVLHRCDNRKCVRPDHLFLGTRADNNKDTAEKGRHSDYLPPLCYGDAHGNVRLRNSDIPRAAEMYLSGMTVSAIAHDLGVSGWTVGRVFRGVRPMPEIRLSELVP